MPKGADPPNGEGGAHDEGEGLEGSLDGVFQAAEEITFMDEEVLECNQTQFTDDLQESIGSPPDISTTSSMLYKEDQVLALIQLTQGDTEERICSSRPLGRANGPCHLSYTAHISHVLRENHDITCTRCA